MAASYFRADAENGDSVDDPSEGALCMMIGELNHTDNTFVVVQPDGDDPDLSVSVSLLDEGGFEVELRDMRCHEHKLAARQDAARIAQDIMIWLAARRREPRLISWR